MKNIEPSNPCFLFIKPKIKPEIKNKSKEIISIINGATFTPLNCINEIINDVIDVNTIKQTIDNKEEIIIFFISSPKVYILICC